MEKESSLGFYLWAYDNVKSVDYILEKLRLSYPTEELVISSDGGKDFSEIARKASAIKYIHGNRSHGPCHKSLEANGRYGWSVNEAKLWLDRLYEACKSMTCDYVMLMEEDVLVKKRFNFPKVDIVMIPNFKNPISTEGMKWVRNRGGLGNYSFYSAGGGSLIRRELFILSYEKHIDSFIKEYERIYHASMLEGKPGWGWNDSIICVLMYAESPLALQELPVLETGNESDNAPIIHNFKKYYNKNLDNSPMKKIVFYHAYLDLPYRLVVQEQLTKIFTSGLYEACDSIELRLASPEQDRIDWVLDLVKNYKKINAEVINVDRSKYPDDWREEKITMLQLKRMADEFPGYYCYIHTKGISNRNYNIELWRHSSDYATIYQWKKNLEMLDNGYDAVGPNLRYNTHLGYYPHFSGTYFWSTHKYLRSLSDEWLLDVNNRFLVEFWIGSGVNPNLGSTLESGHNEPYLIETSINKYIIAE